MASAINHGLDKIPDAQGYLVINQDGAVIAEQYLTVLLCIVKSAGDLENDEKMANVILEMLQTASMIPISGDRTQTMKRMSVYFGDFALMATISHQKIFVVKRPAQQETS